MGGGGHLTAAVCFISPLWPFYYQKPKRWLYSLLNGQSKQVVYKTRQNKFTACHGLRDITLYGEAHGEEDLRTCEERTAKGLSLMCVKPNTRLVVTVMLESV